MRLIFLDLYTIGTKISLLRFNLLNAEVQKIEKKEGRTVTDHEKKQLQIMACKIRIGIIEGTYGAKCGHPGGSLSSADVLTYLYFREMNIDPEEPGKIGRDRFVLSKGHCTPGLYAALAYRGFFPVDDLPTLRHTGSYLPGHPNMNMTPGVDMSTGSLGQGISAAVGMALAAKYQGNSCRVYALLGDGEVGEGQVWEACMLAHHYRLDNLCIIIDKNGLQIDGKVADVMDSNPLPEKLCAFGFKVAEIDGHDMDALEIAFSQARETKEVPFAIVINTVKGKGISYMEDAAEWHGKAPNTQEFEQAMAELNAKLAELEAI